jgi:hypothetical protein
LNVLAGSKLDLTSGGFANVVGGSLNGGTYTIGGTLKYNGADIAAIGSTANLTLDGSGVIRNANGGDHDALTGSLATNNGTLTLQSGANLSLTQAFTNNGDLNVLAGSRLDLTSGGFANVVGGSLNGGTYTIGGALVYNGADITAIGSTTNLTLDGSGVIRNTNGGDHNALTHSLATNNGTLTLENGADLTLTQAFTNNGTLNVLAGSTLDLTAGGIANLVGASLNGGTYTIGGELLYKGDDIKSIGSTASLTLDGSGGSIVNAKGGDHDALAGTLATNNGTLILENGADLALTHEFTNRGNLQVLAGSTLDLTGGFGNVSKSGVLHGGTYTIGGTLDYSGQDITTIGHTASLTLNGGGIIVNTTGSNPDALSDSLAKNNGTLTLENNATLTLSQNFTNHGTLNVLANSNLQLNDEFTNVSGSGVLKGGNYNIAGTLYYSGADIVTLGKHTSLTLNGTGQGIVNTSDFSSILGTLSRNNGTLTLMNGANLQPPGTFTNHGTAMVLSGSGIVAGSIINSGSLTIAGSFLLGDLQIWSGVESGNGFKNTGNVLIESGTSLTVDTGNYTQQTVGSTEIDGTLNGSVDLGGGTLDGTGTINGTLLNEGGTVTPGDAPGILTVNNFTQTSGDLLFNIEGTLPGVDYSQLLVTNAATFGGNIEFDFGNGFIPQSNQVYTLIVFGSSTGSEFGSYTIDNLPAGYTADITYGANDVDVSFVSATPEPASMALMLAGLGAIVFARRRVRR